MRKMISKDNVDFFFKRFLDYCEESKYSIIKSRSTNHYCTIGFEDKNIIAFYNKDEKAVELNFTETLKTKCNDTGVFTFMSGVVENFIMASRFYRVKVKSNKTKIEKDFEGLQEVIRTKIESLKNPDDVRLSSVYTNEDDLTEQTGIVKPVPTQSYFFVDTEGKFDSRLRILFDYKTKTIALTNSEYYKRRMFEGACKENPNFTKIFDVLKESIDEYFFKN